jgi:uncharacterized membrane protein YkvA (DUF1232 family)
MAAKAAILRTVPLMRDERVPTALKVGAGLLAVLVVSPIDLFSDIPVLGALDDVALLSLLCMWFVHLASRHTEPVRVNAGPRPGSALAVRYDRR